MYVYKRRKQSKIYMKTKVLFGIFSLLSLWGMAQTKVVDELQFGNVAEERRHGLTETFSECYSGGLGEPARRLLPAKREDFRGGTLKFRLKVDPQTQNYCTFRFWGSEADQNYCMLFIEGKQIGYRHLGDYDCIHKGNEEAPSLNRFYYVTTPLPKHLTAGKREVELEVRSYGPIWGYGNDAFERFQKPLTDPTVGFYKVYTHTTPAFIPVRKEKQGLMNVAKALLRPDTGEGVMDTVRNRVEKELHKEMNQDRPLNQLQAWMLSDAYHVEWTSVYQDPGVPERILKAIDHHCALLQENPDLLTRDRSIYNSDWLLVGPLARAFRNVWPEIRNRMEDSVQIGGRTCTRREVWSDLFSEGVQYSNTHRRSYTNQSMIVDLFLYQMNRALALLAPEKALPEYQTLRYLYESVGLAPWTGSQRKDGSFSHAMGDDYFQLTSKWLTKELGYVGYYGEVLDWVNDIYVSTCTPGVKGSGDPQIRAQLLRMQQARGYFRYPAVDADGYRAMRIEAVVGWRDGGHYPGNVLYMDRGVAWDATPMQTAYTTEDVRSIGMTRQLLDDNQYWALLNEKMKEKGLRTTHALLFVPEEYEWMRQQKVESLEMPMSASMPDFVFADEENGVLALKYNGEILYVSLYWRARNSVNRLAQVHRINEVYENVATVMLDSVDFEDSGLRYVRPEGNAMTFSNFANPWYTMEGISAHAGQEEPIAKVNSERFRPGNEHPDAGRCRWYQLQYGPYLIGMNNSSDRVYELRIPQGKQAVNLSADQEDVKGSISVLPGSTAVIYLQ